MSAGSVNCQLFANTATLQANMSVLCLQKSIKFAVRATIKLLWQLKSRKNWVDQFIHAFIIPAVSDTGKTAKEEPAAVPNIKSKAQLVCNITVANMPFFNTDDRRHSLPITFPLTSRFMVLMKRVQWIGDWRALLLGSSLAVTKAQWNTSTGTHLGASRLKDGALE